MMEILKFKPNMFFSIWNHPLQKNHGRPVVVYKKGPKNYGPLAVTSPPMQNICVWGSQEDLKTGTVAPTFTIWL